MTEQTLIDRYLEIISGDSAAAALAPTLKECAVMLRSSEFTEARSHLGGMPHLPAGMEWPTRNDGTPLALLLEVFLDEVPNFVGREDLPAAGVLQAWYDSEGLPYDAEDGALVLYHADADSLIFVEDEPDGTVHNHCPVRFQPRVSVMSSYHLAVLDITDAPAGSDDDENDRHYAFHERLSHTAVEMAVGQPLPRAEDGSLAEAAYDSSTFAAYVPHQLMGHMATIQDENYDPEFQLLFQIDSDDGDEDCPGWSWGDAGILWFHIKPEDLKARRFDRVSYQWSCC